MYNIRSSFLHGDLPVLPLHKEHYDPYNYPKHQTELHETYYLSVLLVIATLQKMYQDNLLNLHFDYKLSSHNKKRV